jgi:hypothetical protein
MLDEARQAFSDFEREDWLEWGGEILMPDLLDEVMRRDREKEAEVRLLYASGIYLFHVLLFLSQSVSPDHTAKCSVVEFLPNTSVKLQLSRCPNILQLRNNESSLDKPGAYVRQTAG